MCDLPGELHIQVRYGLLWQWYASTNEILSSVMGTMQLVDLHVGEEYWKGRNLVQTRQLTYFVCRHSRLLTGSVGG